MESPSGLDRRFWKGCKPNSVCPAEAGERIICLSSRYPEPVSLPKLGAGRSEVPYLALHPMGFSVPARLRLQRWALAPPFHPYPSRGGLFSVALSVRVPRGTASRVYPPLLQTVTRHRALRCSDFPPSSGCPGESDSPPFQNRADYTHKKFQAQARFRCWTQSTIPVIRVHSRLKIPIRPPFAERFGPPIVRYLTLAKRVVVGHF